MRPVGAAGGADSPAWGQLTLGRWLQLEQRKLQNALVRFHQQGGMWRRKEPEHYGRKPGGSVRLLLGSRGFVAGPAPPLAGPEPACWIDAGLLLDRRRLVAGLALACCWTRAGLLLDPRRCGSDAELDGLGYRRTQAGWMWARDSCD